MKRLPATGAARGQLKPGSVLSGDGLVGDGLTGEGRVGPVTVMLWDAAPVEPVVSVALSVTSNVAVELTV